MSKIRLYYSPQHEDLAREIHRRHPDQIELGEIVWKRFRDGSPNTSVLGSKDLKRIDVVFLLSLDGDWGSYAENLHVYYHLANLAPKSYRVVMPFYKGSTLERSFSQDKVITANAEMIALGAIGPAGPGTVSIVVYDLHALAAMSFARGTISIMPKSGLKPFFKFLEGERIDTSLLTIVYPDKGSKDRFGEMEIVLEAQERLKFQVAVCEKTRIGDTDERELRLMQGNVRGRRVILIDDLLRSGNTLYECAKMLLAAGALSVDAYVTHVIFEETGWQRFNGEVIRRLYTTDSIGPSAKALWENPHVTVISLADSIFNTFVAD